VKIFEIKPEPVIISDTTSHFLAIFGGIVPLMTTHQVTNNLSAISELQHEIADFTETLTPLLDEAYRIEMNSYTNNENLMTDIEPIRKKIRFPTSTSDWRMDNSLVQTFQSLRNIILGQFVEGRHTAFGLTPSTKQLFFTHILQRDSRRVHEFIGLLQLKILELFSLQNKLHYLSQQNILNITVLLEALKHDSLFYGDDKFIYY
jgi:hypothetical protein